MTTPAPVSDRMRAYYTEGARELLAEIDADDHTDPHDCTRLLGRAEVTLRALLEIIDGEGEKL